MSKLLIFVVAFLCPYLVWAVVSQAVKRSLFTMKSMLRVLSVWHLLLVIIGGTILLVFNGQQPSRYGWGALIFSFGLIWPEQWLKRQMGHTPTLPVPKN